MADHTASARSSLKRKKKKNGSFLSMILTHSDLVDKLLMTTGLLGSLGNGLAMPLSLFITSRTMNVLGVGPSSDPHLFRHTTNQNALNFLYLAGASFLVGLLEGYCWTRTGARQASRMRARYLKAVLRQEVGYFDLRDDQNKFEVVSSVSNDSLVIQDVLGEKVPNFLTTMTRFIGSYIVAFVLMWRLALAAFPFVVLIVVPVLVSGQILMGLARKVREEYNKAGSITEQAISSIRIVYSFVGENKTMLEFSTVLHKCVKLGLKQGLAKGIAIGSSDVMFAVWSFITWYGSRMVMFHGAQGGTVHVVGVLIGFGGLALASALSNLKSFTEAFSTGERIMEVMKRVPTIDSENMEGVILQSVSGEVEFKNVEFTYPSRPDNVIFHNFNLLVPAGKMAALVGASGSGKSTVISLLERFYDPISGQILLDGVSINKLQLKWLRSQMGLVSQEPALFATSIKENILFGKEDATIEEVIAAAKASNAHNFITQLPHGYNTQVGEGGVQMSGGQKQRIAIARAMIKAPRILLLDEATSALDSESEKIVQEALDEVALGRTTIVIAHRLSTIHNADMIAVVQNGQIMESGSHDELLEIENGLYSSLVQLQQATKSTIEEDQVLDQTLSSINRNDRNNTTLESKSGLISTARASYSTNSGSIETKQLDSSSSPYRRRLFQSLMGWKHASLGFVSALLLGSLQPIYALVMGSMISVFFLTDHSVIESKTRLYSLILVGLAVFSSLTSINLHYNFAAMGEYFTKKIRERMLTKLLTFEVGWFDQDENSSGTICSRLASDANVVRSLMGDQMPLLAQTLCGVFIAYTMALIVAWRLAVVVVAIHPLTIASHYIRQLLLKRLSSKAIKSQDQSSKLAAEAVSNIRIVTAFSFQSGILALLEQAQEGTRRESVRQSWVAGLVIGTSLAVISCNSALNFWYGGKLISQGSITSKAFFRTFLILVHTGLAIVDVSSMTTDIVKSADAARSIFAVLDRVTRIEPDNPQGHLPDRLIGSVELRDVHFAYPARPDVTIFKGFSLEIEPGKSTALVGHSGSGKSTIVGLIERFYDPFEGMVVIDGRDVRSYHLRSLRRHVALVSQEPCLFAGSIRDNIAYGAADTVDDAEIVNAARAANAHEFVAGLKEGYDTWCGDRGVQLSGGQKQRIAIARAILKNPAILLLDEATSALDGQSENVVQEALERVMVGRTSVVVAHRMSTIQNCDQIVVLEKGRVEEKGTHSSLMEKCPNGAYFSLVTLQQRPN